jgi:predicted acetyltransferase
VPVTIDLATSDENQVLLDLWQLYMKDLADFRNSLVQVDGRYRDDRLRTYLSYEEHWPFLIRSQGEIVGFALVRKSKPATYVIGELFIKSEFRRSGVGASAVSQILQEFLGNWEIPFQNENSKAAAFWRKRIHELGYETVESELQGDTWLIFSSAVTK